MRLFIYIFLHHYVVENYVWPAWFTIRRRCRSECTHCSECTLNRLQKSAGSPLEGLEELLVWMSAKTCSYSPLECLKHECCPERLWLPPPWVKSYVTTGTFPRRALWDLRESEKLETKCEMSCFKTWKKKKKKKNIKTSATATKNSSDKEPELVLFRFEHFGTSKEFIMSF